MFYDVLVVALSKFAPNGEPMEYTRRRLDAAVNLAKRYRIPYLVLSGGSRGVHSRYRATHPPATEASLGRAYLQDTFTLPRATTILLDDVSLETVGNVVIPIQAFGRALNLRRLLCVTSTFHATRVQQLYDHICRNLSVAVVPVDYEERALDDVIRGRDFVNALCCAVKPGDLVGAFKFVQNSHSEQPYKRHELRTIGQRLLRMALDEEKNEKADSRRIHITMKILRAPAVRAWLDGWQNPEATAGRRRIYDEFTSCVSNTKRLRKFRARNPDIAEAEQALAAVGALLSDNRLDEAAVKTLLHEVPARLWFIRGGDPPRHLTPKAARAYLSLVRLSCRFLLDRSEPLLIFCERNAKRDQVIGPAKLQQAVRQCDRLLQQI